MIFYARYNMRLLNVKNIKLIETHYKAHAEFVSSLGNIEFDFEFYIKDKEIIIKLKDESEYPGRVIKKQLKEWVKDNILI